MASLHIPNFRFSISWSRIFPKGTGEINWEGVDFYQRVIDTCLLYGIEPWITLYHWDLPFELEKKGGWVNRNIVNWFSDYVAFCITTFGDRVKYWIVLNEPLAFTGAGYFFGLHAPGKRGLHNFLPAAHHAALCQSEGGRIIKFFKPKCQVGTTFSCSHVEPYSNTEVDCNATKRADALLNKMFLEPLLAKGYPTADLKFLRRLERYIKDGDEQRLPFDMDFIGIQGYTREIIKSSWITPLIGCKIVKANKRNVPKTVMNWEVHPECLYHLLLKYHQYKNIKELIITENGAAFHDVVDNSNNINDTERSNYLQQHIAQVLRAKKAGVNVNGYFVWSFTDNFEWIEGYRPRFGLVYIDFENQKRIVKQSGKWYGNFLYRNHQLSKSLFLSSCKLF